jgi:hypothetical protein
MERREGSNDFLPGEELRQRIFDQLRESFPPDQVDALYLYWLDRELFPRARDVAKRHKVDPQEFITSLRQLRDALLQPDSTVLRVTIREQLGLKVDRNSIAVMRQKFPEQERAYQARVAKPKDI